MKGKVVSDIANPSRQTGYDHVKFSGSSTGSVAKPYQAIVYGGALDKAGTRWRGPRRATALESAQDYCDYINVPTASPPARARLVKAGHVRIGRRAASTTPTIRPPLRTDGFVYCISDGTAVKIGKSINHPSNRIAELQTGNPRLLSLVALIETDNVTNEEVRLHQKFCHLNILGEWFSPDPSILIEFGLLAEEITPS